MERLLDLKELGQRLAKVDGLIMKLVANRMSLAAQVGTYKRRKGEAIFRADIEDRRIEVVREIAKSIGLNPHFAETLLYLLINESCKLQMIQLQDGSFAGSTAVTENEWYRELKRNLVMLAEQWCESYDDQYERRWFATHAQAAYEQALMQESIVGMHECDTLADLGCGTGHASLSVRQYFRRIIGFDISQSMVAHATHSADQLGVGATCSFEVADLEDGIPLADEVASFVMMNLGTASDMRAIGSVIGEALRILKPGGKFLFSFYNRDALVYRWDFLPWQVSLAALINVHGDCLDVHTINDGRDEIVRVFARAYGLDDVRAFFSTIGVQVTLTTHPAVSSILPQEVFEENSGVQHAISTIDRTLTHTDMGAYIVATGEKP